MRMRWKYSAIVFAADVGGEMMKRLSDGIAERGCCY